MQLRIFLVFLTLILSGLNIVPTFAASSDTTIHVLVQVRTSASDKETQSTDQNTESQRATVAQAQARVLSEVASYNPTVTRQFSFVPVIAMEVNQEALNALRASADVVSVEEDIVSYTSLADSTALIGAQSAWAGGFSGKGQTVAVLDTGIDKTHPFLNGKVVSEACYSNAAGRGSGNSLCPDGSSASTATGSGGSCNLSSCLHGTHVAGIIAGRGTEFSGVARDANLISIQVYTQFTSSYKCGASAPCIGSYISDQIAALERVYELRNTYSIAAVNMSLGDTLSTTSCDSDARRLAIQQLRTAGIATIVAAGNSGKTDAVSAPACISSAVAVGATTDGGTSSSPADQVASFSNSSAQVQLLAPGQHITSSVPGGSFSTLDGTSMAAPHVAGAWAVLKAANPNASVDTILSSLTSTGVAVTDSRNNLTIPRIQLDAALSTITGMPRMSVTDVTISEGDSGTQNAFFNIRLSAPLKQSFSISYTTADKTAKAGTDYQATSGQLVFAAGVTSLNVTVPVIGDTQDENDVQFLLNFSGASMSLLGDMQAIGTIVDNDSAPTLRINDTQVEASSGTNVQMSFVMNLSQASGKTVSVVFSSEVAGFTSSQTVTFAPNETSKTVTITVNLATASRSNNTVVATLSNADNATIAHGQAAGTITYQSNTTTSEQAPAASSSASYQIYIPSIIK